MSTTVPLPPPGPVIISVVKDEEFEIVNVPPPSLVPGKIGQEIDVTTFPIIVAQQ